MRYRLAGAALLLVAGSTAAGAETLGDVLRARGLPPPTGGLPGLDQTVRSPVVLDAAREALVVYAVGEGASARLHAARFDRAARTWTTASLDWAASSDGGAPRVLPPERCRLGLAVERFAGGYLVTAHISPSAECTLVLGPDLALRGVLAGWPVAKLADGRIVYQENQVHFASFHPVALALFDPRSGTGRPLYPLRPYQRVRLAHVERMRRVYTPAWCSRRNHPCDPEVFDEHVVGDVVVDARGDALAFGVAWDNTTGWSDVERWGRLEGFRELRAALAGWDGQGAPPAGLFRGLAAGLARARNGGREALVRSALEREPELRDLVAAALAARKAPGRDERSRLLALDARWGEPATWRRLGRAVEVPPEFTEVVYVYRGLRGPGPLDYRELRRGDFEARFGPGPLARALEPGILRQIFGAGLE